MTEGPPKYKVYRSRSGLLGRLGRGGPGGLDALRRRQARPPRRAGLPGALSPRRLLGWLAVALGAWLLLSLLVFMVSALLNENRSDRIERALANGPPILAGSTIMVLGSDARSEETNEPGSGGPPRADTILLLRAGLGDVRRLSILRDTYAPVPGHGTQKINAAYALGGPALAIRSIEDFFGDEIAVNHVMEVSFEEFPKLIDALGGIDVELRRCIDSNSFGDDRVRLRRGEHRLDGRQALAFARVRKNRCAPNEDDRARAARQQQVMSAIRSRLLSPAGLVRLPWVSWQAPRTLNTDLAGPGLLGLFADVATGGSGETRVLQPSSIGPGSSLIISSEERIRAVRYLKGR